MLCDLEHSYPPFLFKGKRGGPELNPIMDDSGTLNVVPIQFCDFFDHYKLTTGFPRIGHSSFGCLMHFSGRYNQIMQIIMKLSSSI